MHMRFTSPLFGLVFLSIFPACSSQTAPVHEDTVAGSDALITFPAAAYAGARQLAYGQNTTLSFRAIDGFVAVKFRGAKGDLIRYQVTAARDTRSYLVRSQRVLQVLTDASDPSGSFRYTLPEDGEYFVMLRSTDRAALSIGVKLEQISTGNSALPDNQEIVARTSTTAAPRISLGRFSIKSLGERQCTTVSGCGTAAASAWRVGSAAISTSNSYYNQWLRDGVDFAGELQAPPDGTVVSALAITGSYDPNAMPFSAAAARLCPSVGQVPTGVTTQQLCAVRFERGVPSLQKGTIKLAVLPTASIVQSSDLVYRNFEYEISWTRSGHTLRLRSVENRALQWSELYAEQTIAFSMSPLVNRLQPDARPSLPGFVTNTTPLDDEEVLSRITPGELGFDALVHTPSAGATVLDFWRTQIEFGYISERQCGPRTSCTPWAMWKKGFNTSLVDEVLGNGGYLRFNNANPSVQARIEATSTESYKVILFTQGDGQIEIPIEAGRGSLAAIPNRGIPRRDVTVTSDGLLIQGPARSRDAALPAFPYGLSAPEAGYVQQGDDSSFDMLIRFNRRW